MKFEWQADDDKDWEERPLLEPPPRPRRSRWLALFLVVAFILASAGLIYRQLQNQAAERVSSIEQDVVASYQVIRQAATRGDREIFVSLLSGRDPNWTETQKELLSGGLLFDRQVLGLPLNPAEAQIVSVELSPDLTEATLVADQSYATRYSQSITVTLRQTHIFRLGNRRWLLAPPPAGFWGSPVNQEGEYLSAVYPQRDRAIAGRIVASLDELVGQICADPLGLDCPADLTLSIRFDSYPDSLLALAAPADFYGSRELRLPAPSLVGLPIDETGYQALYDGYAVWVGRAVIAQMVNWRCCEQIVYFEALADRQLADLGVLAWPLGPAEYDQLMDVPLHYDQLAGLWGLGDTAGLTAADRLTAYSLVDFALFLSPNSITVLQQRLASQPSLFAWLRLFVDAPSPELLMASEWAAFTFQRSQSGSQPPPLPLPNDGLLFLCSEGQGPAEADLFLYQLATNTWTEILADTPEMHIYWISDLPGGGVVLLEDFAPGNRTSIWREETGLQIVHEQTADGPAWFYGGSDPLGQQLIMTAANEDQYSRFGLLDLNECDEAGCPILPIDGLPVWSPDASQMILFDWSNDQNPRRLFRATGNGLDPRPVGRGQTPFWLDNNTYAYIRWNVDMSLVGEVLTESYFVDVVTASVEDDQTEVLFTAQELADATLGAAAANELSVINVTVNPADPNQLIVTAWVQADGETAKSFLFKFDRLSGSTTLLFSLEGMAFWPLHFLDDGRWLALQAFGQRGGGEEWLYLYDLEQAVADTVSFVWPSGASFGVSADDQWLWRNNEGLLYLYAPSYDYRYLISHSRPECTRAVPAK